VAAGYDDPKAKVHIGDGVDFMSEHKESFDVIITDTFGPRGQDI
jgi:spermidine synthase